MLDPSQSRVVVTTTQENNKPKKVKNQITKVLNKDGKYETQMIPIQQETAQEQIEKKKKEINQSNEVIEKLKAQQSNLKEQVQSLATLVNQRIKQHKEEEKERIEHQKRVVKNNKMEFSQNRMTEAEINERLRDLEKESITAQKYGQILAKDLDQTKKQNEEIKVTEQLSSITSQIDAMKEQLKLIKKTKVELQKKMKQNIQKLQKLENGDDDANDVKRLTMELQQLKEKDKKIKENKMKGEEVFKQTEIFIEKYLKEYNKNCEEIEQKQKEQNGKEIKPKEFNFSYRDEETYQNYLEEKKKKEKEDLKEKKEKEKKDGKLEIKKPQRVQDIIREKPTYGDMKESEENYIGLYRLSEEIKILQDKQSKQHLQEQQQMESKINDLKLEISLLTQKMKEKEKEKDLAFNKKIEVDEQLKNEEEKRLKDEEEQKGKKNSKVNLSPIKSGLKQTNAKDLLQQKKEQLLKIKEKIIQKQTITKPAPFEISQQYKKMDEKEKKELREKKENQTQLEKILNVGHRVSKRLWFGFEPNEQTQICDDVSVIGQFSTDHRIHQITFYHNPKENLIYLITVEYVKNDKKTLVLGDWLINEEMKKKPDTVAETLKLGVDDRIREIIVRRENSFISYIEIQTKKGQTLKIGKEIIEKQDDEKPKDVEPKEGVDDKKENQKKKEDNPDKFHLKIDPQSVLVTFFAGYATRTEKEFGLAMIGFELAKKLNVEEKEEYKRQKEQEEQARTLEKNRRLLEESVANINLKKKN